MPCKILKQTNLIWIKYRVINFKFRNKVSIKISLLKKNQCKFSENSFLFMSSGERKIDRLKVEEILIFDYS